MALLQTTLGKKENTEKYHMGCPDLLEIELYSPQLMHKHQRRSLSSALKGLISPIFLRRIRVLDYIFYELSKPQTLFERARILWGTYF